MIKRNIATSEEGFMFNPSTGDSFSTNKIGVEIINLMQTGHSENEIIEKISQKYEIQKSVIERDLNDFIDQLKDFQLIDIKTESY